MPVPSQSRSAMLFRSLCGDFDMVGIFTENPIKKGSLACIVSTSTSVCMERGRGAPSQLKIWNASRMCVSSLRRGHANLLCIIPILVYVLPKQALFYVNKKLLREECLWTDGVDSH